MSRDGIDGNIQFVRNLLNGESFGDTYYDFLLSLAENIGLVFICICCIFFILKNEVPSFANLVFKICHSRNKNVILHRTM